MCSVCVLSVCWYRYVFCVGVDIGALGAGVGICVLGVDVGMGMCVGYVCCVCWWYTCAGCEC